MRKSLLVAILAVLLTAGLALAWQRPIDTLFQTADSDHNNLISEAEWHAAMQKRFEAIDANHDGNLSRDELEQSRDALRERFRSAN